MFSHFTLLASPLFAALSPVSAQPAPIVGEMDGYRYEYRAKVAANGLVRISGRSLDRDGPFDLVVDRRGRVTGAVDGRPVDFRIVQSKRDRLVAELTGGEKREQLASATSNPPADR
jgi:hypothetical protein